MPFDFFKKSKPAKPDSRLVEDLESNEVTAEEQVYLDQFERNLKTDAEYRKSESTEAEVRRLEIERLKKEYKPAAPLYHTGMHNSSGEPEGMKAKSENNTDSSATQKSYQNDPRYREYFERLRKDGAPSRPITNYDEEVKPASLDELDRQGWNGKQTSKPAPVRPASTPPPSTRREPTPPASQRASQPPQPGPATTGTMQPGTLVHFDDESVAVYKDAVSGKDYALFYFLEPNGRLAPRGIFLEQYEKKKIGQIPQALLDQMIQRKSWDRDAIVFHLDQFDFASCIPASGQASSPRTRPATQTGSRSTATTGGFNTPTSSERRPASQSDVTESHSGRTYSSSGSRRDAMLERGRVLRINVGGRVWESVYWTEDPIGAIVAHNTNKDWALMHLDLTRFKDSLEYGDVLSYEGLSEIEDSLSSQGK